MFLRIRTEVLYALGTQAQVTALVIAVAVAVVNAAANFLVIAIHALDGSDQTTRLDRLSDAIRRRLAEVHQLREQAARHVNQLRIPASRHRRPGTARSPGLRVEREDSQSAVLLVGARRDPPRQKRRQRTWRALPCHRRGPAAGTEPNRAGLPGVLHRMVLGTPQRA